MKRILFFGVIAALLLVMVHSVYAGDDEDAMALAKKGAMYIKEKGREKGFAEIMNPNGTLRKGKIVMTAADFTGLCVAHAAFPSLVGQNHWTLQDANGKYFMQEAIQIAKTKGGGWIEFSFTDLETKKVAPLRAWVQRVEGMDTFVMAPYTKKK